MRHGSFAEANAAPRYYRCASVVEREEIAYVPCLPAALHCSHIYLVRTLEPEKGMKLLLVAAVAALVTQSAPKMTSLVPRHLVELCNGRQLKPHFATLNLDREGHDGHGRVVEARARLQVEVLLVQRAGDLGNAPLAADDALRQDERALVGAHVLRRVPLLR